MMTEAQVRDVIVNVRENYDVAQLATDDDFGEAGLDSLDHASILLELQERTGVTFPEDASALNSIRSILDYLHRQAA